MRREIWILVLHQSVENGPDAFTGGLLLARWLVIRPLQTQAPLNYTGK
jgi:hypothetical protein